MPCTIRWSSIRGQVGMTPPPGQALAAVEASPCGLTAEAGACGLGIAAGVAPPYRDLPTVASWETTTSAFAAAP
jgi:hypothetical protein